MDTDGRDGGDKREMRALRHAHIPAMRVSGCNRQSRVAAAGKKEHNMVPTLGVKVRGEQWYQELVGHVTAAGVWLWTRQ